MPWRRMLHPVVEGWSGGLLLFPYLWVGSLMPYGSPQTYADSRASISQEGSIGQNDGDKVWHLHLPLWSTPSSLFPVSCPPLIHPEIPLCALCANLPALTWPSNTTQTLLPLCRGGSDWASNKVLCWAFNDSRLLSLCLKEEYKIGLWVPQSWMTF